jgi:succinate-semialdehyde dehydrogenase/glutarate-semialdehyde dehydrogenase
MLLADARLFREACYVDGAWITAGAGGSIDVDNPATGETLGSVPRAHFRCGAVRPRRSAPSCCAAGST